MSDIETHHEVEIIFALRDKNLEKKILRHIKPLWFEFEEKKEADSFENGESGN